MWLFTTKGFISVVVKRDDPTTLLIRSRVKEDITAVLGDDVEVFELPGSDYLYRAYVPREKVAATLAQYVLDMTLTSHFKDVALKESAPAAGRHTAYYSTWTAMSKLQPYAPYSRWPRGQEPRITYPSAYHYTVPSKNTDRLTPGEYDWTRERTYGGSLEPRTLHAPFDDPWEDDTDLPQDYLAQCNEVSCPEAKMAREFPRTKSRKRWVRKHKNRTGHTVDTWEEPHDEALFDAEGDAQICGAEHIQPVELPADESHDHPYFGCLWCGQEWEVA